MAKKEFTAESGLGFMRVIQIFNIVYIFLSLVAITLLSTNYFNAMPLFYNLSIVIDVIGQSLLVWMLARRKIHTREYAIIFNIIIIISDIIVVVWEESLGPSMLLQCCLYPTILIIYFATSRRVKAVLVQPYSQKLWNKRLAEDRKMYNLKSIEFWMRLLIYFFVFSVVGHWMEMGVQILVVNGVFPGTIAPPDSLTWKDSLGPFCIYGIAFAICGLVLYPIYMKLHEVLPHAWQAFVLSFIINALFCALAELILGMLFNANYTAWDYRDQFLNFQGQVCLLYTLSFGVISSLMVWVIYPFLEHQFSYIGRDAFRVIFIVSAVLFVLLILAYNTDKLSLPSDMINYLIEEQ